MLWPYWYGIGGSNNAARSRLVLRQAEDLVVQLDGKATFGDWMKGTNESFVFTIQKICLDPPMRDSCVGFCSSRRPPYVVWGELYGRQTVVKSGRYGGRLPRDTGPNHEV